MNEPRNGDQFREPLGALPRRGGNKRFDLAFRLGQPAPSIESA